MVALSDLLDPAIVFPLLLHRRAGLLSALVVMLLDAADSHAAPALHHPGFPLALPFLSRSAVYSGKD